MEPTAGRPPAAWLPVRAERSDGNKTLLERLPEAFEGKSGSRGGGGDFESERSELHSKIGELTVKLDFAVKKSRQLGL